MGDPVEQASGPAELPPNPFWTISNLFSLMRIILTPPALYLLYLGTGYRWEALGMILFMAATDWLDGYFARRRGEVTRWGKILDPLADKLALDSIAIALAYLKGLPVWVVVVMVGRDVLILLAGVFLIARRRVVEPSNAWGKRATVAIAMLLLAYMLDLDVLKVPLLALGMLMILATLISYGVGFLRRMRTI